MDGTLVVSEKLKGEALVQTCIAAGGSASLVDYKQVMGGSWETVRCDPRAYPPDRSQSAPQNAPPDTDPASRGLYRGPAALNFRWRETSCPVAGLYN